MKQGVESSSNTSVPTFIDAFSLRKYMFSSIVALRRVILIGSTLVAYAAEYKIEPFPPHLTNHLADSSTGIVSYHHPGYGVRGVMGQIDKVTVGRVQEHGLHFEFTQ